MKMRKTKIICTIGPASEKFEQLCELIESGMNVARLNFSHGSHEEHGERIKNIRKAAEHTGKTVAILLDTKGPEIRTNDFVDGKAELAIGAEVTIVTEEILGTAERFSVSYSGLIDDVAVGSRILIDDGLIELEVIGKTDKEIKTKVLNSGTVKNKKGVNVPNVSIKLPGITEKDKQDILFGIEQDVDFIAASFVRKAADVLEIRDLLKEHNGEHINIMPKIENQEGITNIDEILEVSDALMVARGDLGVEIPPQEVPLVQKRLIKKCNNLGIPVVTATQMLESMQQNPRPTRAEASDVANAILDGTDAIMLSGETAAGKYPVESVRMQAIIAETIEASLDYESILRNRAKAMSPTITNAIGQSVAYTAANLAVSAILTATESGSTAHAIAKYRPETPIIAITTSVRTQRRLALAWGVHALVATSVTNAEGVASTDDMISRSVDATKKAGFVKNGEVVILTAGIPIATVGTTNMMKVHVVGSME